MQIHRNLTFSALLTTAIFIAGCGKNDEATEGNAPDSSLASGQDPAATMEYQVSEIESLYPEAYATPSGLHFVVTETGSGPKPQRGQQVTANYHGTLLNGKVFDSSIERGKPFKFTVGIGQVIKGWDEAFLDMKRGEKRTLVLPSELGYGTRGAGPIPPNSILVFDVELIDFE